MPPHSEENHDILLELSTFGSFLRLVAPFSNMTFDIDSLEQLEELPLEKI